MESIPCAPPFDQHFCQNGGSCFAELEARGFHPFCVCPASFHGRTCQHIMNTELYGYSTAGALLDAPVGKLALLVGMMVAFLLVGCLGMFLYCRHRNPIHPVEDGMVTFMSVRRISSLSSVRLSDASQVSSYCTAPSSDQLELHTLDELQAINV